ncbi:F-type H+-transporting ATPase subunit gamma [Actinoplanes campanulatus]|uniref:ATP synthase gamma chain n=1 Tax=Actinoplanes campanulatus TaxID=113559 RepID=A0A7W5ABZ1_9ACTN|nr:F0F1 ATP synthase subunit gamma [Actinoplanes campanulatus]MBB3093277.1 F-type H+-transporting ATPase subunit gamma [Actinoplanes campanulatus]GGN02428.1 ATP synthase gamma chain [Actinoplanes campanulatus]GID33628.1 ATP synthase gamma chain [Actinoplanes campanulatus]
MAGQVQALRRRIRTVKSTKKIAKAQELVATSRIAKAQERVNASRPYAEAITKVLGALATNASVDNPLLVARERVQRAGVLLITSDRGLAGAYNANAIRTAEQLIAQLKSEGKEVAVYIVGRKGLGFYRFRNRPVAASWTGFSERPSFADAKRIGDALIEAFEAGSDADGTFGPENIEGVDELHIVSTEFKSLMTQSANAKPLAPVQVEKQEKKSSELKAAYEFEPEADELLDALLPKYLNTRLYAALLDSAASESASRRRAMKSASDNADDLLKRYTREMNSARQAAITQEISEIVGGANALAAAGSDV